MHIANEELTKYCYERTRGESELASEIATYTREHRSDANMLTGRIEGQLLKLLACASQARRVLEVGTFTGYSALSFAEALPAEGQVITCEVDPANAAIAQKFFDRSPHGKKIHIKLGPALQTLAELESGFDMAFLDADKQNYPAYYEAALGLCRPGGLLIVDNCLWSGEVLAPSKPDAKAIAELNDRIANDDRVENVLLTVRDGINLVRKR